MNYMYYVTTTQRYAFAIVGRPTSLWNNLPSQNRDKIFAGGVSTILFPRRTHSGRALYSNYC